jgi:hypothetical protein
LEVILGRYADEERGDGAPDELVDVGSRAGFENVMYIPCTPTVQSRYEDASSKSVSNEMLR